MGVQMGNWNSGWHSGKTCKQEKLNGEISTEKSRWE